MRRWTDDGDFENAIASADRADTVRNAAGASIGVNRGIAIKRGIATQSGSYPQYRLARSLAILPRRCWLSKYPVGMENTLSLGFASRMEQAGWEQPAGIENAQLPFSCARSIGYWKRRRY